MEALSRRVSMALYVCFPSSIPARLRHATLSGTSHPYSPPSSTPLPSLDLSVPLLGRRREPRLSRSVGPVPDFRDRQAVSLSC
jgi:hypothetical protein